MPISRAPQAPPFCPNPDCFFHVPRDQRWQWVRYGSFCTRRGQSRVPRFRCLHCRRTFSTRTFQLRYWLKRPELLRPVFHRLLGCSGFRQIAREFRASPSTVMRHAARLGRHALLVHQLHRPANPCAEPLALDSFISFEFSQYNPTAFHLIAGQRSHFFYGFTDSELRRSGRMTTRQKRRRAWLEARFGRPDPRSIEHEVASLLALVAPAPQALELHSDEHRDYPRALLQLPHLQVTHLRTSSRAARTTRNPLFPINLLDLLIRHGSANHKRETIAFSKRRQSAADRLWILLVWRNYLQSFSERKHDATPAMRLGLLPRPLVVRTLLARRLFPTRIAVPTRWSRYYWHQIPTRRIPRSTTHNLRYAS